MTENLRGPLLHAAPRLRLNGTNDVCLRITNAPRRRVNGRRKVVATSTWLHVYEPKVKALQARFPGKRVGDFTQADLFDFFVHDAKGRRRPEVGQPGWTQSNVNGHVQAFVFAFTWAFEAGLIEANPATRLSAEWRQDAIHHREGVWLEDDEIEDLCDLSVGDDITELRERVVCSLLFGSGLRESECISLDWGSVKGTGENTRVRVLGKGEKYRTVTLISEARDALEAWRKAWVGLAGREPFPDEAIIPGRRKNFGSNRGEPEWGTRLGVSGVLAIVKRQGARIRQPELSPHDLRRSHAGYLDRKGVPLKVIQAQLGHGNVATTDRYLNDNPARRASALAGL